MSHYFSFSSPVKKRAKFRSLWQKRWARLPILGAIAVFSMGSVLPSTAFAATIEGFKFEDVKDTGNGISANGVKDDGEPVLSGHIIFARNNDTSEFYTAETISDGSYSFDDLALGTYLVWSGIPTGKCQSVPIAGEGYLDYEVKLTSATQTLEVNFGISECPRLNDASDNQGDACETPTVSSTQNGNWNDPIWKNTDDANAQPREIQAGDLVKIQNGHIITTPNAKIDLGTGALCNEGTLQSQDNVFGQQATRIEIKAASVHNKNMITGKKGIHGNCGQQASAGSSILIFTTNFKNEVAPAGLIRAGNGGNAPEGANHPCPSKRCGEGQNARGGNGGSVEIYSATTNNTGTIISGNGGNAGAAHAIAIGGDAGVLRITANTDDNTPDNQSSSTGMLQSGHGGKICAPIQRWQDRYGRSSPGKGGDLHIFLKKVGGKLEGSDGSMLYWDPINLIADSSLNISGFDGVEIYTDEGGTIDLTQLSEGAISATKTIKVFTKSQNGEGGTVDLQGINHNIFKAGESVEIFADNLLLDNGITLNDLADAPQVTIDEGKIPYRVALSAQSDVVGEPGATLSISVKVNNSGPQTDTYAFNVTDSAEWTLGTLTKTTIDGLDSKELSLNVTLPSTLGAENVVTITATSQADSTVVATTKVNVSVNPGDDSDGDGYPNSRDAFPADATEWLDSDGDGIGNNTDSDDDNDGMPDEWEKQYEGLSCVLDDAEQDADGDGFTNLEENQKGTNPDNSESKPANDDDFDETKTITSTIAVDNNYALFYGTASKVSLVGSGQGWKAEIHTFTPTTTDYIYIVGWSDHSAAQGLLAKFASDRKTISTGDSAWQVYPTNVTWVGTAPPSTDDLSVQIQKADDTNAWLSTYIGSKNGMSPWGTVQGISETTKWIWHESGQCAGSGSPLIGSCNHEEYLIFRLPVSAFLGKLKASGTIRDELGNPIAGVTVQIGNRTTTTDEMGQWEITGLPEGEYTVTASKEGYPFAPTDCALGNNEDCKATFVKAETVLTVNMVANPRKPQQGDNVTYTITVMNGGEETATGIVFSDVLPENVALISIEALDGGNCDAATVTCSLPDLTTGNSARVKLVISNNQGNRLENRAQVVSNEYPTDVAEKRTYVTPHLSVTMSCTPKQVAVQNTLSCTAVVELSSLAPSAATGVELVMTAPNNVELQSLSTDYGMCDVSGWPTVVCSLTDLSVDSAEATSTVTVKMENLVIDPGLLVLKHEAKVSANEYGVYKRKARNTIFVGGIEVDIAFVIDITGSMQGEINGIIKALLDVIAEIDANNAPLIALVTFRDEDEVELQALTSDLEALVGVIKGLKASGGGTCNEASAEAISLVIPHVKNGGTILFATDASPYPDADIGALAQQLTENGIRFNPVITGDCTDKSSWNNMP